MIESMRLLQEWFGFVKVGWSSNQLCHHCKISLKHMFDDPKPSSMADIPHRDLSNFEQVCTKMTDDCGEKCNLF